MKRKDWSTYVLQPAWIVILMALTILGAQNTRHFWVYFSAILAAFVVRLYVQPINFSLEGAIDKMKEASIEAVCIGAAIGTILLVLIQFMSVTPALLVTLVIAIVVALLNKPRAAKRAKGFVRNH